MKTSDIIGIGTAVVVTVCWIVSVATHVIASAIRGGVVEAAQSLSDCLVTTSILGLFVGGVAFFITKIQEVDH